MGMPSRCAGNDIIQAAMQDPYAAMQKELLLRPPDLGLLSGRTSATSKSGL